MKSLLYIIIIIIIIIYIYLFVQGVHHKRLEGPVPDHAEAGRRPEASG